MAYRIPFNMPPYVEGCMENMRIAAEENHKICGDGPFTAKCSRWLEERMGIYRALLTSSCTHALEMAMHLLKIEPGDEVITPSYTFCSAADAIVLRGGVPVFVDIRPDTMNIDENLIEDAITEKTRAIAVMHNAGVACEMDRIMEIAEKHGIDLIEDAAHAPLATYHGKQLGTFGRLGTFSFHETKNYSMGEGGAILLKTQEDVEAAEILREKGTDRSRFFRGQVDKYRWVDYGSSYLPGDLNAAYLYAQLERADEINASRLARQGGQDRSADSAGRLRSQRPYVLYQGKGPRGADRADRMAEGARHPGGLPLCAAPLVARRPPLRAVPRRGRLYDARERASRPPADVLPAHGR